MAFADPERAGGGGQGIRPPHLEKSEVAIVFLRNSGTTPPPLSPTASQGRSIQPFVKYVNEKTMWSGPPPPPPPPALMEFSGSRYALTSLVSAGDFGTCSICAKALFKRHRYVFMLEVFFF